MSPHEHDDIPRGLRELADFFEHAEDIPMPSVELCRHLSVTLFRRLLDAPAELGFRYKSDASYPTLSRRFGPVTLRFQTDGREMAHAIHGEELALREAALAARETGADA